MTEEKGYWQRRVTRRRVLRGAALGGAGLAAAAVIGCAEEEKPGATPAPATSRATPTPGAATPTPAAAAPKKGGKLVAYDLGEPPAWNLNELFGYRSVQVSSLAFPQLTRFKRSANRGATDFDWEPHLAKEVNQPDNLTVTLKLQPNAKYAPRPPLDGRKVTSADVKWSWEEYFAKKNVSSALQTRVLESLQTPDPETLVFKLKRPQAPFVFYLNHHAGFFHIPKEFVDKGEAKTTTRGGENGPFMLKEFKVGQSILWEKNPNYFDADNVYVNEVEVLLIPDPATVTAGVRSKSIHTSLWVTLPPADVPSLKKDVADATFVTVTEPYFDYLSPDLTMDAFKDVRVRRALSMALDRDAMLPVWRQGTDLPAAWASHMPSLGDWQLNPKTNNADYGEDGKWFKRDPAEARKLLEAAGWDFNKSFPFKTTAGAQGQIFVDAAEVIKRNLADAGVKLDIVVQDGPAYYAETYIGKHQNSVGHGFMPSSLEPDEVLFLVYTDNPRSGLAGKQVLTQDATLNDFIDKQSRETNREARKKIIVDWQKYMAGKMYSVPIISKPAAQMHQKFVKNVSFLRSYGISWLYNAWLDL